MSRILVIDDDAGQLEIRKLLLEHAGYAVTVATTAAEARECFSSVNPRVVLVDLRLQSDGDGFELIREFRQADPQVRIVVISGWAADLSGRVEESMVDAVIPKPSRSAGLISTIARLAAMLAVLLPMAAAKTFPFTAERAGEAVAQVTMSAPGANWSKAGAEAAMADVRVDDGAAFQVMVYAGDKPHGYRVFLGAVAAGVHRLTIDPLGRFTAAGTYMTVEKVEFKTGLDDPVLAHAPVLYARRNTVGKFTDVPMVVYAENLREGADSILQYTVIFTNEDGGTSTRALMARWGRTTDIEYVYRLNTRTDRAIIQSRNHKDIEYDGPREGKHPVLMPITDNNMVGPVEGEPPPVRYQIAPVVADLSAHSREHVMDESPILYRIAAEELAREGKLRAFGTVDGENISDPRNYLYVEAKVSNLNSGLSVNVRLKDDSLWRAGALGRADYAISRSEWIRTTVELPPGTMASQIGEIGLECVVAPNAEKRFPLSGECKVDAITKVFLLDRDYRPGANVWTLPSAVSIPSGLTRTYRLR